jgi:hypothetical protein
VMRYRNDVDPEGGTVAPDRVVGGSRFFASIAKLTSFSPESLEPINYNPEDNPFR